MKAAVALLILAIEPAAGQLSDDSQFLLQLGYVAGQAVACDIEKPDVAATVATAMADAAGLTDEASHRMMATQALRSAAEPCAAPLDRIDDIRCNWKAMRRRAGVD